MKNSPKNFPFYMIITLMQLSTSALFAQEKKSVLDSIKVNAWEEQQIKNYLSGDKAKERAQLLERIAAMQKQIQLMDEAKDNVILGIFARTDKKGQPIDFRRGYLIIQK